MSVDLDADSAADSAIRVFISYSHDSEEHAERVLQLANRLRSDGVDAWIDQYETAPSRGWPKWMEDQVEQAKLVLCVCTETYRRRIDQKEEPGRGLGATWEGALIRMGLYLGQGKNERFIPLLFESSDAEHIPTSLMGFSYFEPLDEAGYDSLYRHLTGQPRTKAPPLGNLRVLGPLPRHSFLGKTVEPEPEKGDALAGYGQWAREHYSHLDLIGIDAGDVQVKLEEVYVPLRVAFRHSLDAGDVGMFRGGRCLERGEHDQKPIELEQILQRRDPRHVLIFGEPGSGKTTALLKLHQLCLQSPTALGLAEGTVPVFLRLRHFDKERLDQGLAAFIDHEVRQLSGGRQEGLGERLWKHKRLLLLFDGLDEIADADHRAEVLRRIGWYLGHDDGVEMRAVVSCRRIGLPGREADRDHQFQTYEVRPFQNKQIKELVTLWFRELARRGKIEQGTADRRVSTIIDALGDPQQASQQILEMASNPLLLTLLCVVVLLGNEIPKKRVRFYEQCLDVLLDRWPRQRGKMAPVELGTARDALAHLAFHLHSAQRRDDLTWAEAVAELLGLLGEGAAAEDLFDWFHGDVGLLVDYTEEDFGFVHLGLQEHLTARHLIANPGDLDFLAGDFDESWWTEVFLQVCALSERAGFDALMTRLVHHTDALERRAGLLRDCLRETTSPELGALVRVLKEDEKERQMAVLRLLGSNDFRPPELLETLEALGKSKSHELAEAAQRLLQSELSVSPADLEDGVAVVIASPGEAGLADRLARRLRDWRGGRSAEVFEGLGRKTGKLLKFYRAILVLTGPGDEDWKPAAPLRTIYGKKLWLVAALPGARPDMVPEVFSDCEVLDWTLDEDDALIEAIVARIPRPTIEDERQVVLRSPDQASRGLALGLSTSEDHRYTEPLTGAVFLPVPGGSFMMGDDDLFTKAERKGWPDEFLKAPTPACRVRVSPYWLASTPVTNEQYGRFLAATEHEEPETWRDRRFSDPHQPVVNVSWIDAVAYCEWLSASNPDGYTFELPSEAQWEFAARGPESQRYPWGESPPSDRLACYGLNHQEDKPAVVGSYPEGAGPFGHLDLAGLVWEWCRDAWETDLSRWAKGEPLDPVGQGDENLRPLRGGAWWYVAGGLRSAIRSVDRPGNRDDHFGFRLLWCPPSLGSASD